MNVSWKAVPKKVKKVGIRYPGIFSQNWFSVSWKITLNSQNYLLFLPERMEIEKKKKPEKLVTNLHDKNEYVIYIRNLKQSLNSRLILKKVPRVTKFNQEAWLKPYFEMDTKLRKKQEIILRL